MLAVWAVALRDRPPAAEAVGPLARREPPAPVVAPVPAPPAVVSVPEPESAPAGLEVGARNAEGFVPLFNGRDLTGWVFPFGHEADWEVRDGLLRGEADRDGSTIATARDDYADFELAFEVRLPPATQDAPTTRNTHVLFRQSGTIQNERNYRFATGGMSTGTVDSLGSFLFKPDNAYKTPPRIMRPGIVERTAPPRGGRLLPDLWHDVRIHAVGNRFRMDVHGEEISAYEDRERRLATGRIAFFLHRHGVAEFRDIRIRELPGGRDR